MDPLPRPSGWWLRGFRYWRRTFDAALGAGCVLAAPIGLLAEPGYHAAWASLAAAGVCLVMRRFTHGRRYGRDGEPYLGTLGGETGLVLPYSERRRSAARVSTVAFGVVGGAGAVGAVTIPDVGGWIGPFGALIAVCCAGSYLRNRRAPAGGVVLSLSGVTLVDGRRTKSLPWADVAGVKAGFIYSRYGPSEDHIETEPPRRCGPKLMIPADPLAIEPTLAYWTLRHYAHSASHRPELADGRAVRRVEQRDLA